MSGFHNFFIPVSACVFADSMVHDPHSLELLYEGGFSAWHELINPACNLKSPMEDNAKLTMWFLLGRLVRLNFDEC